MTVRVGGWIVIVAVVCILLSHRPIIGLVLSLGGLFLLMETVALAPHTDTLCSLQSINSIAIDGMTIVNAKQ